MTRLGWLKRLLRGYARAERGTVLVLFAMTLLPLMVFVGGFVDYGRLMRAKGQLEAAADAGILAAQLQYSLDDEVDYERIVSDYVAKNMSSGDKKFDVENVTVDEVALAEEGEMRARVSGTVPMTFLSLIGLDSFDVSVETAAKVGGSAIEVALVLDNTRSMLGSKIDALKDAAKDLVEAIMIKPDDPKIKFALVPFADYVRLDEDDRNEPGLDIPADYDYTPPGTNCWNTYPDSTQVCTPHTTTGTCWGDQGPYSCPQTSWSCTGDLGEPVEQCEPQPTQHFKWYGCMGSRPHDLNTRDDDYGTQGVPGIMDTWDSCSHIAPVIRLTSKRADIISGLNDMNAEGWTYIPSGLVWGWRALSSQTPFADGVDESDKGVRKVIVLMTDGANTRSTAERTGGSVENHDGSPVYDHSGWNTSHANEITSELCSNIKAADVMLYTISFDVEGDAGIQDLLRSCAGNGGQYYNADDNAQLADAFRQIGLALLNLRLSR